MQSLVLGATGIVGGYIVEHLVRSGEMPLALSRAQRDGSGVVWLKGDFAKPEALRLPPFEILYCTAGTCRRSGDRCDCRGRERGGDR